MLGLALPARPAVSSRGRPAPSFAWHGSLDTICGFLPRFFYINTGRFAVADLLPEPRAQLLLRVTISPPVAFYVLPFSLSSP